MPNRLIVLASYMQDISLSVPRPPLAGETLSATSLTTSPGGKGSNQAVQAARCGAEVAVLACLGQDSSGDEAVRVWQAEGIDVHGVRRTRAAPTGTAVIQVEPSGENRIIIASGANLHLTLDDIAAAPDFAGAALVVSQLETPLETVLAAFRRARAAGVATLLNTAPAPESLPDELWALTDYIVSNRVEGGQLTGLPEGTPLPDIARTLRGKVARAAILTAGADGALAVDDQHQLLTSPACPAEVIDTTGAGDAFIGALAAGLAHGLTLADSLIEGVIAGAVACEGRGVVPILASRSALNQRKTIFAKNLQPR